MMNYEQWMSETKRGILVTRSAELKALDKAFENLSKSKPPQALQAEGELVRKLKAWLDAKGADWRLSTRNATKVGGKGTVERLIEDLSKNPLHRPVLAAYAVQKVVFVPQSKIIVLSGHGSWEVAKDSYTELPAKCSIKFYTVNMKTLSDSLGGDIDRGIIAGLEPDQEAGPYSRIPDMRLYPPTGLNIRQPDPATWQVARLPDPVPANNKNLQIQIKPQFPGGASLSVIFEHLAPAIHGASSVTFLWAACRAIGLRDAGGKRLGINRMQR